MSIPEKKVKSLDELRRRAEEKLKEREGRLGQLAPKDAKELLHELGTYQIELEMQNEELRRAQEVIEESRRKYADLYDFAPVGYLTLDRFAYIREMNLTAAAMLGMPRGHIGGKNTLINFVSPNDLTAFRAHITRAIAGKECSVAEFKIRRRDGTSFDAQVQSAVVEAPGEPLIRMAVSDITEIKRAEAARIKAEEAERAALEEAEALRVQRLENLRVLAGGIAHDLNNLMVAVGTNTELALKELSPGDAAYNFVHGIEKAVEKVSNLSRQVLSYTGKNDIVKEPLDINALVKDTTHLLMASLSRKAKLECVIDPGLQLVMADHQNVQQILMNFLINASDALKGEEGTIRVTTGTVKAKRAYLNSLFMGKGLPEGGYAWFEVSDTGAGMSEETKRKVFEPFYTTKSAGRGLGLAAVYGIVEAHGGAIELESGPGKGTRFRALLPLSKETVAAPREEKAEKDVWHGSGTVLVVDDEEDVLTLTRMVLQRAGYEVLAASSGEEAIEIFTRNKDRISAVVMDFIMPTLNGDEVYRELCKLDEGLKCIFLSGYHEVDVEDLNDGRCTASVLQKPYKLDDLLGKVHELVEA